MEKDEILKQINALLVDILNNENVVLNMYTQANDVEGWDSLVHIQFVVAMEKHFKIRFISSEIRNWKSVGEIVDSVFSKL